jgi:cytochrome b
MSLKTNFALDLTVFLGFLVALEPGLTGTPIHEWFTLALAGTLVVHLLIHWNWVINLSKRFFNNPFQISRLNYLLAALIFIGFTVIITSGLMISESVLPLLGLQRAPGFAWRGIHETATNLTLLLVMLHFALHWTWIKNAVRRIFVAPFRRRGPAQQTSGSLPDRQE